MQSTGAAWYCEVVAVGGEGDRVEGGNGGGGHVPLGTSCAVGRGNISECGWVGMVGFWGHEHVVLE